MRNLNLLFNKEYFRKLGLGEKEFSDDTARINEIICKATFSHELDYAEMPGVTHRFLMQTAYPGLMVGTGYAHGTERSEKEIAVGFSFDYVTGQPYIPGSSVKGVLRSHFKQHPHVVAAMAGIPADQVPDLETEIFEGKDVFFDAVIYDGNEYGEVVGQEYITPHRSPTESPVPISMLKVLPGVRLEFRFILNAKGILPAEKKSELFRDLIAAFGIGAKTNVGYGIMNVDTSNGAILPKKQRPAAETNSGIHGGSRNGNRNERSAGRTGSEKVACPKCGFPNFKYKKNSTELQTYCYKCRGRIL